MGFVPAYHRLEAKMDGVWADVTRDVLMRPASGVRGSYGIRGAQGPLDLVADTGSLKWLMNNSHKNSMGLLGGYSILNPLRRQGWDLGIEVRHYINGHVKFHGWLDDADSAPGRWGQRDVSCVAVDWLDHAAERPISGLATLTNVTATQIFNAIVAAVPVQPVAIQAQQTSDVYAYALDTARAEKSTALTEFRRISQSGLELIYVRGDGTLVLETRDARTSAAAGLTLGGVLPYAYLDSKQKVGRKAIKNKFRVTAYPRTVDGSVVTLYTHQEKSELLPGEIRKVQVRYVDPAQKAARVGGTAMVAPVATTDYTANSKADGSGVNLTANLSVAAEFGGDSAELTLQNTHASSSLFVTFLRVRGKGLYTYDTITVERSDAASIQLYGERLEKIDMPYQSSSTVAAAVADGLLEVWKRPTPTNASVRFCPNESDELMALFLLSDISTPITIEDSINGTASWYVNGVDYELRPGGILFVTYHLAAADLSSYFRLDVDHLDVGKLKAF